MSERCRHRNSWLIAGARVEWCYQCGAFRRMEECGPAKVTPTSPWCRPVGPIGGNPFDRWQKRAEAYLTKKENRCHGTHHESTVEVTMTDARKAALAALNRIANGLYEAVGPLPNDETDIETIRASLLGPVGERDSSEAEALAMEALYKIGHDGVREGSVWYCPNDCLRCRLERFHDGVMATWPTWKCGSCGEECEERVQWVCPACNLVTREGATPSTDASEEVTT